MKNSFQTILLFIFGIGAVVGVASFALYQTFNSDRNIPEIDMWGSLPAEYFTYLDENEIDDPYLEKINYREIRPENFDQTLVEALADGNGPDLILLKHDSIYEHRNRVYKIPFENYSASDYYDTYIQAAEIFEGADGFYALPAVVDPMVMYWNRSILSSELISSPPSYWDEMRDFSERITQTDGFLDISRSAVSLGTYDNITNAKDILSLLLMQSGSPIVTGSEGSHRASFSQVTDELSLPPSEALNFYTEFANPERGAYTWNSSLPSSRESFLAEDLALYFGFASEESELIDANPNLSFGVSMMPQVQSSSRRVTFGDLYGFAVIRNSDNTDVAFNALYALSSQSGLELLDERTGLPSVHNSLLAEDPTKASSRVFVDSTLITKTWFDPDRRETYRAFKRMVESVRSNARDAKSALDRLSREINNMFGR
ncbi:MAG: extracellular solute-binding protein [Candidatus Campbellbacteria bacterium]|nr:extracellular solute-binding protein [Candidatus Campbellbacteria bacterium]